MGRRRYGSWVMGAEPAPGRGWRKEAQRGGERGPSSVPRDCICSSSRHGTGLGPPATHPAIQNGLTLGVVNHPGPCPVIPALPVGTPWKTWPQQAVTLQEYAGWLPPHPLDHFTSPVLLATKMQARLESPVKPAKAQCQMWGLEPLQGQETSRVRNTGTTHSASTTWS